MTGSTTIFVCTTCRSAGQSLEPKEERAGFRLFEALSLGARTSGSAAATGLQLAQDELHAQERTGRSALTEFALVPVECLSVCKRPCTVAFAAPGKWTYVYGDLPDETSALTILAGAKLYAEAPDGLIPWKQRPDALKKGVVARIPPLETRS